MKIWLLWLRENKHDTSNNPSPLAEGVECFQKNFGQRQ
jgi:hypothetical protein